MPSNNSSITCLAAAASDSRDPMVRTPTLPPPWRLPVFLLLLWAVQYREHDPTCWPVLCERFSCLYVVRGLPHGD